MLNEYTPSTDEVRAAWQENFTHPDAGTLGSQFDRWLNQVRAEVLRSAAERLRQKGIWAPQDGYQHTWEQSHYDWLRDEADRIEERNKE